MKKLPDLSIFFPFWNEEKNVEPVVNAALKVADKLAQKWEILIIDDGSVDRTREIAERIASNYSDVRVISHSPNRGYGAALKEGLTQAKYDYIVFTDGDLQFDFSEVVRFVEKIDTADI